MNNTRYIKKSPILSKLSDYYLTPEEDAAFMANIDMEALERGMEQAEKEIANGEGIEFEEAMKEIDLEVFGEEL